MEQNTSAALERIVSSAREVLEILRRSGVYKGIQSQDPDDEPFRELDQAVDAGLRAIAASVPVEVAGEGEARAT